MTLTHSVPTTRREVLSGLASFAAVATVSSSSNTLADRYSQGYVRSSSTGEGIAGVMVSNGYDVALTGADGSWELEVTPDDAVFVIKPAGFTYLTETGVPALLAEGLAQRGKYDFYLRPQIEPDAFEVALVADTQASDARELDYVRREFARSFTAGQYAFAISHGDVMGDNLSLLAPYKDIVASTGMVWHHCPGNHDMDLCSPTNARAFDTWKREMGPPYYAFQYANATFLILNNVEYFGTGAERIDGRLYRGRIGERQLAFVRNVLRHVPSDQLVVVSMHVPLVSFENPKAAGDNTADRSELMQLLSAYPNTVSFSGHSHTTEHHYLGRDEGFDRDLAHHHHVLTAFCGGWWGGPLNSHGVPVSDSRDGSPRGFHVLSIDGKSYRTRFVPVGDSEASIARLALETGGSNSDPGTMITVDVFDGGPRTRIVGRIPGTSKTFDLTRAAIPDPHIVESYAAHRDLLKPWVEPAPSSHIWTATLPEWAGSAWMLDITDEYGASAQLSMKV